MVLWVQHARAPPSGGRRILSASRIPPGRFSKLSDQTQPSIDLVPTKYQPSPTVFCSTKPVDIPSGGTKRGLYFWWFGGAEGSNFGHFQALETPAAAAQDDGLNREVGPLGLIEGKEALEVRDEPVGHGVEIAA